jgi:GT2 family glycosyltransferase
MDCSVIIPTYGRSAKLRALLEDLARTTGDHEAFEVIVVVDGPSPEPLAHGEVLPETIRFRGLTKEHAGPAAARNHGIAHADGRWLLFFDDEARVDPETIPGHLERIRADPAAHRAHLGRVDWPPQRLDSPWSLLLAESSMLFFWNRMRHGCCYGFRHFWTSNLSVPRDCVRSVGGFHEGFPSPMHEDIELGWRLQQGFGLKVEVAESISSLHDHPLSPEQYLRREHTSGRCAAAARDINRPFHDEVWSWVTDPAAQLGALQDLLGPAARRTLSLLEEWARPSDRRPTADEIDAVYLAHLPLKRTAFLHGYLGRPFDELWRRLRN